MYNNMHSGDFPIVVNHGSELGSLWFIGWLFTIGYLRLNFWRGVLAIIIWPYYLGKHYAGKHNN